MNFTLAPGAPTVPLVVDLAAGSVEVSLSLPPQAARPVTDSAATQSVAISRCILVFSPVVLISTEPPCGAACHNIRNKVAPGSLLEPVSLGRTLRLRGFHRGQVSGSVLAGPGGDLLRADHDFAAVGDEDGHRHVARQLLDFAPSGSEVE